MDPRSLGLSAEDLRQLGYNVGPSRGEPAEEPSYGGYEPPSAGEDRPSKRKPIHGWAVATLVLLGVTAWAVSPRRALPEPAPAASADTSFSSARAMTQLFEIGQRPRPEC